MKVLLMISAVLSGPAHVAVAQGNAADLPAQQQQIQQQPGQQQPAQQQPGQQQPAQQQPGQQQPAQQQQTQQQQRMQSPPAGNAPVAPPPPILPPAPAAVREPPQVEIPDASKSAAQRNYENAMQQRLTVAIEAIEVMKRRIEGLKPERKRKLIEQLQTAEGNRSVARTKLKQLRYITPAQWTSLTVDIDQAFVDLERSVAALDKQLNAGSKTQR